MKKIKRLLIIAAILLISAPALSSKSNYTPVHYHEIMFFSNGIHAYEFTKKDLKCLYDNVYHEARSEDEFGQLMVVVVTMTRVFDKRWKDTVCGVVYEGVYEWNYHHKDYIKCAFSWACDRKSDKINEPRSYKKVKKIVNNFLKKDAYSLDFRYTPNLYHRNDVKPWWSFSQRVKFMFSWGVHIFYREE